MVNQEGNLLQRRNLGKGPRSFELAGNVAAVALDATDQEVVDVAIAFEAGSFVSTLILRRNDEHEVRDGRPIGGIQVVSRRAGEDM